MTRRTASAPATIANLGPGFDVLGLCLEGPRDTVTVELTLDGRFTLEEVTGEPSAAAALSQSRNALDNCVGVVAQAVLRQFGEPNLGAKIWLHKGLPIGSGLGSSAASSVAAALATAACLDPRLPKGLLFDLAREGERLASGSPHPDNVAPALFGGILACMHGEGEHVDLITLGAPRNLQVVAVKPNITLPTAQARHLLPKLVPMQDVVHNLGAVAGLVKALLTEDLELMRLCFKDRLATPYRAPLIPGYAEVEAAALELEALGFGIAGSGPSVFAFAQDRDHAIELADVMVEVFESLGLSAYALVSAIDSEGAQLL